MGLFRAMGIILGHIGFLALYRVRGRIRVI